MGKSKKRENDGMKVSKPFDYRVLKRDFIFVNILVGVAVLLTFLFMLLQRIAVIPSMPCIIHDVMHIYCPGCGGTRAMFALLQGHVLESLYYNPAVVLGVALGLHYELGIIITLIKKNGKRYYCTNWIPLIVCGAILLAFTIIRNYLLIGWGYDMLQDFLPR